MRQSAIIFFLICVCTKLQAQIITTICGNDTAAFSGDDGFAINAKLYAPEGLCLDKFANIYIADAGNNRVRKITAITEVITTVAGTGTIGFSGDNGAATNAESYIPEDVFTDTVGNLF